MELATPERPLILFLDSLDQLSTSQDARSLIWLPASCRSRSRSLSPPGQRTLQGPAGRSKPGWRSWAGSTARRAMNCSPSGCKVSSGPEGCPEPGGAGQLRAVGGQPAVSQAGFRGSPAVDLRSGPAPEKLAPGWRDHENNMIDRLEQEGNHGEVLVSHALGYLAASRYGLAEDELVDLLSRDLEVYALVLQEELPPSGRPGAAGDRVPPRATGPAGPRRTGHPGPGRGERRAGLARQKSANAPEKWRNS